MGKARGDYSRPINGCTCSSKPYPGSQAKRPCGSGYTICCSVGSAVELVVEDRDGPVPGVPEQVPELGLMAEPHTAGFGRGNGAQIGASPGPGTEWFVVINVREFGSNLGGVGG